MAQAGAWDLTTLPIWLVVPLVLAAATAFTKVVVVLMALRAGLGAETLLPGPAVWTLALVLTAGIMGPLWSGDALQTGVEAAAGGQTAALLELAKPLVQFVHTHASPDELAFFSRLQTLPADHLLVAVPAFMVTELIEALRMALVIVLPFLAIDIVLAQVLAFLSWEVSPRWLIALPPKLGLFAAVGGFNIVVEGLWKSYQ